MGTDKFDSVIVGELTSGSLHKLNNLMQGIVGLAELLNSNPDLPEDAKLDAKSILDIAGDASELVKKIKGAAKAVAAKKPTPVAVKPVPVIEADRPKNRGEVTILVAEDDPLVLNVVSGMLKALGYNPMTAQDGAEALEIYEKNAKDIDLIIADLAMPRKSGLDMAEELLTKDPKIRIVVMTGYIREELDINPDEFGLAGWLEKPMTAHRLEQVIQPIVGV